MKYLTHDAPAKLILLIAFMAVLFFTADTFAQWEEIPSRGTTVDFAGTFNNKANAFTGTAIHAGATYWAGVQGSQIAADGEIKSQDMAARAQGGVGFLGVSAQFFIEATRGMETEIATATGGYIRKVVEFNKLAVILGVGSFIEREEYRADLGLDETAPSVLPYWLWSAGTEYDLTTTVGVHARVIATPEGRFRHWRGTLDFGADIVLSDRWTLKLQSTTEFRTDGDASADTENSVIFSLNL